MTEPYVTQHRESMAQYPAKPTGIDYLHRGGCREDALPVAAADETEEMEVPIHQKRL